MTPLTGITGIIKKTVIKRIPVFFKK